MHRPRIISILPPFIEVPNDGYGAIESISLALQKGLTLRGVEFLLACKRAPDYESNLLLDPQDYISHKDRSLESGIDIEQWNKATIKILADACHANTVVLLNHYSQAPIREWLECKGIRFYELVHYYSVSGKDRLIFPSKHVMRIMRLTRRWSGELTCSRVIPHPVDESLFSIVNGDRDALYHCARIHPNKSQHISKKISTALDMECYYSGPIQDRRYFKQLDLAPGRYLGSISREEIELRYSRSVASFCVTSFLPPETHGLFQIESLLSGVPVITSLSGGLKASRPRNYYYEAIYGGLFYSLGRIESSIEAWKDLSMHERSELRAGAISYCGLDSTSQRYLRLLRF